LTQQNVVVDATATVGLNVELKVGSATEQVNVDAAAPALHTEDATLGVSMGNRVYDALPLSMGTGVPRDPTLFIALVPGVAAVVTQASGPSYTSFNGAQQETNELYLEGIAMTFPNQQGDTRDLSLGVSVEAVEQFQVEINGQKAMYQGQGMQLRAKVRESSWRRLWIFRNTKLDAGASFSPFVPVDRQNGGGNIAAHCEEQGLSSPIRGYHYNTATAPVFSIPPC
jgi:hypothetical protein